MDIDSMMNINHLIFLNRENQRAIRAFLTLTFLCSTTSPISFTEYFINIFGKGK